MVPWYHPTVRSPEERIGGRKKYLPTPHEWQDLGCFGRMVVYFELTFPSLPEIFWGEGEREENSTLMIPDVVIPMI